MHEGHLEAQADGIVSDRAWARYLEIAARIAARCTDEELGITPADYQEEEGSEEATPA